MGQIMSFLAAYAEELSALLSAVVLLLLLVALHRMNRITKMIRKIGENTEEAGVRNDMRADSQSTHQWQEKKDTMEKCAENGALTPEEYAALLPQQENLNAVQNAQSMQPEELLTDVLDEVFT